MVRQIRAEAAEDHLKMLEFVKTLVLSQDLVDQE
jgi:hypothetical protein